MTDARTKFIRKTANGKGWEYGYSEVEIRMTERRVIEHIVGHALTLQEAAAAWLDSKAISDRVTDPGSSRGE